MQKKITPDQIKDTEGPMNSVAWEDALHYLGLEHKEKLTPQEERLVRAKKHKIVTSSKKHDRRINKGYGINLID